MLLVPSGLHPQRAVIAEHPPDASEDLYQRGHTMDGARLKRTGKVFATAMNLYGLCVMSVPEGMLLHSSGVRERAG